MIYAFFEAQWFVLEFYQPEIMEFYQISNKINSFGAI